MTSAVRLLASMVIAVLGWMTWLTPVAVATPSTVVVAYGYDSHDRSVELTTARSERGPPSTADDCTLAFTADHWSHGDSTRPNLDAAPGVTTAYDVPTELAKAAGTTGTTSRQAWMINGGPSALQRSPVAAKTTPQVLKGPIADAIPKNLPQQMALDAAKAGHGRQIMGPMGDAPRLVANYGEGEWVKMQYVLRGNNGNVTVHYFRNLDTGLDVEFKFP